MASGATSPSSVSGTVWEFQRDDGRFSPFPPQVSAEIEAKYLAGATACTPSGSGYGIIDLKSEVMQTRPNRKVKRSSVTLPVLPPIEAYWSWNERDNNFVVYSIPAVIDIELAYQQAPHSSSRTRSRRSPTVDLSQYPSGIPYAIDFSAMKQTRHGYGTQRAIKRCELPTGISLQSLLQSCPLHSHSPPHSLASSSGSNSFSLACGPATSMLKASVGTGGGVTSATAATAAVSSVAKPTTRKGRGKKRSPSKSSSPSLGRRDKTGETGGAGIPDYVTPVKLLKPTDDGPCPICMCELSEQSGYDEDSADHSRPPPPYAPPVDLCKLRKCGHMLHRACLLMLLKSESSKNGLTCPTCKKVHGIRTGDMPDGTMTVRTTRRSLPGHEGYGMIEIVYNFSPGVHNGHRYSANGFPRTCYLPDSQKGQKVLKLLKIAWERRLTFTIGTSVTTGVSDTVVWNEIHHKTESSSNYSGHGYPDPNYLDNVLMELSLQGVGGSDSASSSDDSL